MSRRVPPIGPKDAKIFILGESPGPQEVKKGEPFIGLAGQQLDRMLHAAGIQREELYITNVVKTLPPSNDAAKKEFFFRGGNPTQVFMEGILEIVEELKEVKPNVVVPLGNYALWAMTQESRISKWRGSIMESTLVPGQKVIPTIHPAFYVHGGSAMSYKEPLGIWDLQRVKEESAFPEINLPSADFIINPTEEQIEEAVDRLLSGDHITADTEWYSPEELAYIGFTNSPDWAICIPADSMAAYRAYKRLLGSDIPKIWQNAMFDVVALARIGIETRNVKDDTMIAWHSCWADIREKGLDTIGSVLTRWPYYKDDLGFVNRRDPRGQIYCSMDCVVTEESMKKIEEEEFDYTRGRRGYEISMSTFDIFAKASEKGLRLDVSKLLRLKKEYLEKADFIERTLSDTVGYTVNCRSPKQVASLVYDTLGVERKKRTTKQEVLMDIAASTSDETLKAILTAIVRVRQNRNIVSRYINENIIDRDKRLRTNWNLAGTRSGRFSTTDPWWNGLALQTAPDEVRECIIPDEGYVFIGWDLAQAEARVVAVKTKDYDLLDDMERGADIHVQLASQLPFGLTYEELIALCEEKGKDNVPQRYISKKCRHALNYVMGADTFRLTVNKDYLETGIGLGVTMARDLKKAYLDLHPGLRWWWKQVEQQLRQTRSISNCYGRVRQFTGYIPNAITEAVSFEPQSTVADLTTQSIARASERLRRLEPNSQCFAHMHDGGFFQVRKEIMDEAVEIVRDSMTEELIIDHYPLTIPVEVKVSETDWRNMQYV